MKRRTQAIKDKSLLLAVSIAGVVGLLLLAATPPATATFLSASPTSSSAAASAASAAASTQPQQQYLFDAPASSSRALAAATNATAHKLELLVESLGNIAPPWLRAVVDGAGNKTQRAKKIAALDSQPQPETQPQPEPQPQPQPSSSSASSSSRAPVPAALPYDAPPPDSWLAADPCHAVPSPCADTPPFSLLEVRSARASPPAAEGGGRLRAPAHLAPLTPTAPWSRVSGPDGVGPNPYWVTGEGGSWLFLLIFFFEKKREKRERERVFFYFLLSLSTRK